MKTLLFLCALPFVGTLAQAASDTLAQAASDTLAVVSQQPDTVSQLFAFGGAVATSAILAASKKLDTKVTNATLFRKAQPLITLGGAFLSPFIASKLGVQIDPAAYAAAPASTLGVIAAAELLGVLKRSVRVKVR